MCGQNSIHKWCECQEQFLLWLLTRRGGSTFRWDSRSYLWLDLSQSSFPRQPHALLLGYNACLGMQSQIWDILICVAMGELGCSSLACVCASPSLSVQNYVHKLFEGCSTKVKGLLCYLRTLVAVLSHWSVTVGPGHSWSHSASQDQKRNTCLHMMEAHAWQPGKGSISWGWSLCQWRIISAELHVPWAVIKIIDSN